MQQTPGAWLSGRRGEHGQFSHSVTLKVFSPHFLFTLSLLCLWHNMGSLWWLIEHLQIPKAFNQRLKPDGWNHLPVYRGLWHASAFQCVHKSHEKLVGVHNCITAWILQNSWKQQIWEKDAYFAQNSRHAVFILIFSNHYRPSTASEQCKAGITGFTGRQWFLQTPFLLK